MRHAALSMSIGAEVSTSEPVGCGGDFGLEGDEVGDRAYDLVDRGKHVYQCVVFVGVVQQAHVVARWRASSAVIQMRAKGLARARAPSDRNDLLVSGVEEIVAQDPRIEHVRVGQDDNHAGVGEQL